MVAYALYQLRKQETNYHVHYLGIAEMFFNFKIWRAYLYDEKVKIFKDHKSLKYILMQGDLNHRQRRWVKLLADYDLEILYHPEKANQVPNTLSRRRVDVAGTKDA